MKDEEKRKKEDEEEEEGKDEKKEFVLKYQQYSMLQIKKRNLGLYHPSVIKEK